MPSDLPDILARLTDSLAQLTAYLTAGEAGAQGRGMQLRGPYIGAEPDKLAARLHAQGEVARWLAAHGFQDCGAKQPDLYDAERRVRWKLTTLHALVYARRRQDSPGHRATWGEPIARLALLDLAGYFLWCIHDSSQPRPSPFDVPELQRRIAYIASVQRAARAVGPGYRNKIVWDEE